MGKVNRPQGSNTGILLIDKETHTPSFHLVALLRRLTRVQKIGHAGTLDPFATGVMVLLIGSEYTKKSDSFLSCDKQYRASLTLGIATDTYDLEGQVTSRSDLIPSLHQIQLALAPFNGDILQTPPMFSAKKIQGKKLYELARKGISIARQPALIHLQIQLLRYDYPHVEILVDCSKGTYVRSLAHDIGQVLGCGAHLSTLTRTRSGTFTLAECIPQSYLKHPECDLTPHLRT